MVLYKGQTKPIGIVSSSGYAKRNAYVPFKFNSTEYDTGYIVTKTSEVVKKTPKTRRRPYIKKR